MSRRAVMWGAFLVVHLVVAWLGWIWPSQPMGDVYFVYEPWSGCALYGTAEYCGDGGQQIVGMTVPWVYPQLALVPMMLPWVFSWVLPYIPAWALVVTLVDAVAFGVLVGRAASRGRRGAAWFWLAFIFLLGPVGMYRLEGITVPLAILGALWIVRRPWLGATVLAVATWIKVWPAALLAAAFLVLRRRIRMLLAGIVVSVATVAIVAAAGGAQYAFGFVGNQTGRGLQIEAPISTFYLWRSVWGFPDSWVYYDHDMLTFQVTGVGVDPVIAAMTPLLVVAAVGIAGLGLWKLRRGASILRLFPALSLAFVLAFIVVNKVGSPQFMGWMIAPIVLGLVLDRERWWSFAAAGLGAAALTQLVYPLTYDGLLAVHWIPVLILTARNVLIVALFVASIVRLVRVQPAVSSVRVR